MDVVSQFVCQHDLDFVRCVAVEHGIAQHDAARIAQAHQGSVGGGGLAAQVHSENAAHARVGAFSQCQQSPGQLALGQRAEFVEEWQDQYGCEICHHYREEEQDGCNPQPPGLRLGCQQQVNQFDDKDFKNEAERQPFAKVQQPVLQG